MLFGINVEYVLFAATICLVYLGEKIQQLVLIHILKEALRQAQTTIVPTTPTTIHIPVSPAPTPSPSPATPPTPTPAPDPTGAVDEGLVNFIKTEEGFRAKAYWDYKQWTIGYGTKATGPNEVISQSEAETRLRAEIAAADALVTKKYPSLPKGAHQALTDLTFNTGSGWEEQSLGTAVAEEKWDTVKADILQYNHAGGQVNAGLTLRREKEVSWFDNPL